MNQWIMDFFQHNAVGIASLGLVFYKLRKEALVTAFEAALNKHSLACKENVIEPLQSDVAYLKGKLNGSVGRT